MEQGLFITMLILSIAYAVFLSWCTMGWMRLRKTDIPEGSEENLSVSVIIPARNEEENLEACLNDFLLQDYPGHLFEVIVVNDHSTDRTAEITSRFITGHPMLRIRLLSLKAGSMNSSYKKQAITEGIATAGCELILTTDADCRRGPSWVSTFARSYRTEHAEMLCGPVVLEAEKNWFEKIQSLEFMGLVAIGAGAIKNRRPFLCNGANLAFSRKAFEESGGYNSPKNISSGDDTQLLLKISKRGSDSIIFLKNEEAIVATHASKTPGALLSQRRRWASKIPRQMNVLALVVAVIAFFLHAGLFISALIAFSTGHLSFFLLPFLVKIVPEFILLLSVCRFFRKEALLYLFLPAQVLYPLYISFVGLMSLSGTYQWKGRQVK